MSEDEKYITHEELQKMYIEGKITNEQMNQILIENLGVEDTMKLYSDLLKKCYGNIDLMSDNHPL